MFWFYHHNTTIDYAYTIIIILYDMLWLCITIVHHYTIVYNEYTITIPYHVMVTYNSYAGKPAPADPAGEVEAEDGLGSCKLGVSDNSGYLRVPLKGYYKGTKRVPLKGSIRVWTGLEFPKLRGTLFWGSL